MSIPHMPVTRMHADPWIKVGTTTIDGTIADVVALFDDANMTDEKANVFLIRGQYVKRREYCATSLAAMRCEVMVVGCDIVRRQSEIDAERNEQAQRLTDELGQRAAASAPPCPECGPHGNRGEVLLASSWAKCTTCAGGKAGDLWGGVEVEMEVEVDITAWPTSQVPTVAQIYESYRADIAAGLRVPKDILFGEQPSGFKVPTIAEQRREVADIFKSLIGPVDAMSADEWRKFVTESKPGTYNVVANGQVVLGDGCIVTLKDGKVVSIDGAF